MASRADVTRLLTAITDGDERAADRLLPCVYDELRDLAEGYLSRERPDHTLQPTALVHEAYLRLVDQSHADWHLLDLSEIFSFGDDEDSAIAYFN